MKCNCEECNCKKEKKVKASNFTKDTTIGEVLSASPKLKVVLEGFGMHCFGCPLSQMETLEEASQAHGIELNFMLEKLNTFKK